MLPGFKKRLVTELHELKSLPKYKERLAIETFKLHSPPAKENYAAWLGGEELRMADNDEIGGIRDMMLKYNFCREQIAIDITFDRNQFLMRYIMNCSTIVKQYYGDLSLWGNK